MTTLPSYLISEAKCIEMELEFELLIQATKAKMNQFFDFRRTRDI